MNVVPDQSTVSTLPNQVFAPKDVDSCHTRGTVAAAISALHVADVRIYPFPKGRVTLRRDTPEFPERAIPAREILAADPQAAYDWLIAQYSVEQMITLAVMCGQLDELKVGDTILERIRERGIRLEYWAEIIPGGWDYRCDDGAVMKQRRLHYHVQRALMTMPDPKTIPLPDIYYDLGFVGGQMVEETTGKVIPFRRAL